MITDLNPMRCHSTHLNASDVITPNAFLNSRGDFITDVILSNAVDFCLLILLIIKHIDEICSMPSFASHR